MAEELKLIVDLFKNATENALYAYVSYLVYGLAKISIIVFPVASTVKYISNKLFVDETKKD